MVDPQIVVLVVAGSSPVGHPIPMLTLDLTGRLSLETSLIPSKLKLPADEGFGLPSFSRGGLKA